MYNDIIKNRIRNIDKIPISVKASIAFLVCSILQKTMLLITTPIFTRLLTVEQYGQFTIYNSWLQLFTIITTFRLEYSIFNKGMSKYSENKDEYTVTMQTITTVINTIVLILYLLFRERINAITELSTFITLAILIELYFTPAISFWMLRQRYDFKYKGIMIVTILMSLSNVILGVSGVMISDNKGLARITSCVLVQVCMGAIIYIHNIKVGKTLFVAKYAVFAILFNLPLIPHYFASYILAQSDKIMIQKIAGIDKAAIYGVAYSVGMGINMVTTSINNALIPWQYRKLQEKDFKSLRNILNIVVILIASVVIIFLAFVPEFMKIIATSEYYESIKIIPFIATTSFFLFLFNLFGNVELYYNSNKFTMYISVLGAILNIILNYIFIIKFGYEGAAYTTLICYIVFTVSHMIYMNNIVLIKEGEILYEYNLIVKVSVVLIVMSLLFSYIYKFTVYRYIFIISILLPIIYNRKKILLLLKNAKIKNC